MAESLSLGAPADADEAARALGARIRALRTARGMTLTRAAAEAELSHSFLSQVERGLERLSMASLFRIARALGTTQQALLTDEPETEGPQGGYEVFRQSTGSPVDAGGGPLRVLAAGGSVPFVPMVYSGAFDDGIGWQHDEDEFLYVLDGTVTVVLDGERVPLTAGDAIFYRGGVRHSWVTAPGETCRILAVKEYRHGA